MRTNTSDFWMCLGKRLLFAAPCFGLGFWIMSRAGAGSSQMAVLVTFCAGASLFIIGAMFIAPLIAEHIGLRFATSFLLPDTQLSREPLYSVAQSLVKKDRFEDAMTRYLEIAREFPKETKPHLDMISIAVVNLHDLERADAIYQHAMSRIKDPRKQKQLTQSYRAIRSQGEPAPDWLKRRKIAFRTPSASIRPPKPPTT